MASNGEICVNTLKKDWKADLGIKHVLLVSYHLHDHDDDDIRMFTKDWLAPTRTNYVNSVELTPGHEKAKWLPRPSEIMDVVIQQTSSTFNLLVLKL